MMDGERALEYARTRHADSDFQRMQRQQLIIVGRCAIRCSSYGRCRPYLRMLERLPQHAQRPRLARLPDPGHLVQIAPTVSRVSFGAVDERMVVDTTLRAAPPSCCRAGSRSRRCSRMRSGRR